MHAWNSQRSNKNIILKNAVEDRVQITGGWETVLWENKTFGKTRRGWVKTSSNPTNCINLSRKLNPSVPSVTYLFWILCAWLFYLYVCMYACEPHVWLVLEEVRRGCHISCNWLWVATWVLEIEPRLSGKVPTVEAVCLALVVTLLWNLKSSTSS